MIVVLHSGERIAAPFLKDKYTVSEAKDELKKIGPKLIDTMGNDREHSFWSVVGNHIIDSSRIEKNRIGEHLYFMQNEKGLIKIGRSNNPKLRKLDIEFEMGYRIKILAIVRKAGHKEIELHRKYKNQRKIVTNILGDKCREWFNPSVELLEEITKITNG